MILYPRLKTLSFRLGLLALVVVSACDAGDNTQAPPPTTDMVEPPTLPAAKTVNGPDLKGLFAGETAEQFYGAMVYKAADAKAQVVLIPEDRVALDDKKTRFADMQIYLLPASETSPKPTFLVIYREEDQNKPKKEGDPQYEIATIHTGEWSIVDTKLVLTGFATAETGLTTTTRYKQTFRTADFNFKGEMVTDLNGERGRFTALVSDVSPEKAKEEIKKDAEAIKKAKEAALAQAKKAAQAAEKQLKAAEANLKATQEEIKKAEAALKEAEAMLKKTTDAIEAAKPRKPEPTENIKPVEESKPNDGNATQDDGNATQDDGNATQDDGNATQDDGNATQDDGKN